jgi:hypothetical protein
MKGHWALADLASSRGLDYPALVSYKSPNLESKVRKLNAAMIFYLGVCTGTQDQLLLSTP